VSEPAPLLDREGIEEAFRRLGDRLAKRGAVADIYVFGGAAMALAYDSRRGSQPAHRGRDPRTSTGRFPRRGAAAAAEAPPRGHLWSEHL